VAHLSLTAGDLAGIALSGGLMEAVRSVFMVASADCSTGWDFILRLPTAITTVTWKLLKGSKKSGLERVGCAAACAEFPQSEVVPNRRTI
jgi:hypothetical protein